MRHAGEGTIDYKISITISLPKRDAILKSKINKQRLASVLSNFSLGENARMKTKDDGAFSRDEANIMVSNVVQAANYGKYVIVWSVMTQM